jgi:hypothetical protein
MAPPVEELPVMELAELEIDEEPAAPVAVPLPMGAPPRPPSVRMPAIQAAVPVPPPAPMMAPTPAPVRMAAPPPPPRAAPQAEAAIVIEEAPLFEPTGTPLMPSAAGPRSCFVEGEHRVIIHTVEGQVKRGVIRDVDLLDESIALEQQTGFTPERIPGKRMKAIFFMLPAGARQPQAEGQKIRVTFNDGRQVAGFSRDFKDGGQGFFLIPADNRTNTARIFVYRSSIQAVAEG